VSNIYRGATVRPVFFYENTNGGFKADIQLDLINLDGNSYSFESNSTGWQTTSSNTNITSYSSASWSNLPGPGLGTTGRWNRDSGGTPSTGTGRTDAQDGTHYIYAETTNPANAAGFKFLLRGPQVTLGNTGVPTFTWYEARESSDNTMGTLKVYLDVITSGDGGASTGLSPLLATTTGNTSAWTQQEIILGTAVQDGLFSLTGTGTFTCVANDAEKGFRITQGSTPDTRITEAGDSRISEQFAEGLANLTGTGTFAFVANVAISNAAANLQSLGSKITASGLTTEVDPITLSGTGSMTAIGGALFQQSLNLTGTGTASFIGLNTFIISKTLNSTSSAIFDGIRVKNAATSLSASSSFPSTAVDFIHFGEFKSISEEFFRITEAGDNRFTEASDTRIVVDTISNASSGFLSADCTQIFFSSEAFFKWNGQWTTFTPKVKQSGVWDDPLAIYKKIDANTWKRAF